MTANHPLMGHYPAREGQQCSGNPIPCRITPDLPERLLRLLRKHYPPSTAVRTGPAHQLGVDVWAVAKAAGIARTTLYRLLDGGRTGQIDTIEAVCLACGTDLRGLYD